MNPYISCILLNGQFKAYIRAVFVKHSDGFGNNWTESFRLEHIFETFKNRAVFENLCLNIQLFES